MRSWLFPIAVLVVLAASTPTLAQQPQMKIGDMTLELGMDEFAVANEAAIHQHALVTAPETDRIVMVFAEPGGGGWNARLESDPEMASRIGSLNFEDGVLTGISKRWTVDEDAVDALFAVTAEFTESGLTSCTLVNRHDNRPLLIQCGGRTILVDTTRDADGVARTDVTELVQSRR